MNNCQNSPTANIGLWCRDVVALDIDGEDGQQWLDSLPESQRVELEACNCQQLTPNGAAIMDSKALYRVAHRLAKRFGTQPNLQQHFGLFQRTKRGIQTWQDLVIGAQK